MVVKTAAVGPSTRSARSKSLAWEEFVWYLDASAAEEGVGNRTAEGKLGTHDKDGWSS
jgi:hypothetical protein